MAQRVYLVSTLFFTVAALMAGCNAKPDAQAMFKQADAAIAAGKFSEASLHLKNILQANPNDGAARLKLATISLQSGDFSTAESEVKRALELGVAQEQGAPVLLESIAMQFDQARVVSEVSNLKAGSTGLQALSALYAGNAQLSLGDADKAQLNFEKALQLKPDYVAAKVGLLAVRLLNPQDRNAAKTAIYELAKQSPNEYELQSLLAKVLGLDGKIAQANEVLLKSLVTKHLMRFMPKKSIKLRVIR